MELVRYILIHIQFVYFERWECQSTKGEQQKNLKNTFERNIWYSSKCHFVILRWFVFIDENISIRSFFHVRFVNFVWFRIWECSTKYTKWKFFEFLWWVAFFPIYFRFFIFSVWRYCTCAGRDTRPDWVVSIDKIIIHQHLYMYNVHLNEEIAEFRLFGTWTFRNRKMDRHTFVFLHIIVSEHLVERRFPLKAHFIRIYFSKKWRKYFEGKRNISNGFIDRGGFHWKYGFFGQCEKIENCD